MHEFIIELAPKIWILILIPIVSLSSLYAEDFSETTFNSGWIIFSSEKTNSSGNEISTSGFKPDEYYKTNLPKTVFAALVENGVYKNPYFGNNLLNISKEPFQKPWWYRKEFYIDELQNINYQLTLEGVNYKADLWINGKEVAGSDKIEGVFGRFNFDITNYILKEKTLSPSRYFPRNGETLLSGSLIGIPLRPIITWGSGEG